MLRALRLVWLVAVGLSVAVSGSADPLYPGEPPLETPLETLQAALKCTPFDHPNTPPVLLVHGTFTAGFEQWEWTYLPLLAHRGFDVCIVTYPDRGLGDMQVAAEYIVHALRFISAESGRKVAMIGHSQGASMPRWALKWWPSAREAVDDFVMLAGPNHGIQAGDVVRAVGGILEGANLPVGVFPAAFYQFASGAQFVTTLNAGEETPGDIAYTSISSGFYDELIQPVWPVPTAALDWGHTNPNVVNTLLQNICLLRFVDHVTIGLTDRLTFELVGDAITHDGPAHVWRAGGLALCGRPPLIPDQLIAPQAITGLLEVLRQEAANSLPDLHLTGQEPPLKPYAQ